MDRLFGDAERVKAGMTLRLMVAVWDKLPDEPKIVSVTVPMGAIPDAVNVKWAVVVAGF
jgi:hypothetical protein